MVAWSIAARPSRALLGHDRRPRARHRARPATPSTSSVPGMLHAKVASQQPRPMPGSAASTCRPRATCPAWWRWSPATTSPSGPICSPTTARSSATSRSLAIDKVRFVGEPVVAAVAVDDWTRPAKPLDAGRGRVRAAAGRLRPVEALRPDAPAGARRTTAPRPDLRRRDRQRRRRAPTSATTSSCARATWSAASPSPTHVFEDVFTSPPVQHVPLETHVCVAEVRDGHVTVWATTQIAATSCGPSSPRCSRPADLAGAGDRAHAGRRLRRQVLSQDRAAVAALSLVARRPVRLHLTREEEFVTITKHGVRIRLKTGLTRDGQHRRPQEHVPLQHRRLRRHRAAAHQERRLRHRRPALHPERVGRLVRRLLPTSCRPARSAATASPRPPGPTRRRWT